MVSLLYSEIIETFQNMERDKKRLILQKLITDYARESYENASHLLEFTIKIHREEVEHVKKKMSDLYQGLEWAVNLNEINSNDDNTYFSAMVPVCKVMFPKGYAGSSYSMAQNKFFEKFIKLYKKEFSWGKDGEWAKQFDYEKYFELLDENIKNGII